jgi:hypothetical protein
MSWRELTPTNGPFFRGSRRFLVMYRKVTLSLLVLSSLCLGVGLTSCATVARSFGALSSGSVWDFPEDKADAVNQAWHDNVGQVEKLATAMRSLGAGEEAINAMRTLGGDGYVSSFFAIGVVDLASVVIPLRANTNLIKYLVNGQPSLISLEDLVPDFKIDITKDPAFPRISQSFPNAEIFALSDRIMFVGKTTTGSDLVLEFDYPVLNGFKAAEQAGWARIAVTFDSAGRLKAARLTALRDMGSTSGGYLTADLSDRDVVGAFAFAREHLPGTDFRVTDLVAAQRQVVAGVNVRLTVTAERTHNRAPVWLEVTVYRDLNNRDEVTTVREVK